MIKNDFLKKFVFLICLIIHGNLYCQISDEGVFKKYAISDTTDLYDAVLILYKDGSFINFGLVNNKVEKDWYLWFSTGNYVSLSDKILLKSGPETNDYGKLVASIKKYYFLRPDHSLIATSYEQQRDNYVEYPLIFNGNNLYDEKRKFLYFEKKK